MNLNYQSKKKSDLNGSKIFNDLYLMNYITTFIHKDPRKKYSEQEDKRQKVIKTLNQDLQEYPSRAFCWNCDECMCIDISEDKRFFVKGDSGLFDTCLECEKKFDEEEEN